MGAHACRRSIDGKADFLETRNATPPDLVFHFFEASPTQRRRVKDNAPYPLIGVHAFR